MSWSLILTLLIVFPIVGTIFGVLFLLFCLWVFGWFSEGK